MNILLPLSKLVGNVQTNAEAPSPKPRSQVAKTVTFEETLTKANLFRLKVVFFA